MSTLATRPPDQGRPSAHWQFRGLITVLRMALSPAAWQLLARKRLRLLPVYDRVVRCAAVAVWMNHRALGHACL